MADLSLKEQKILESLFKGIKIPKPKGRNKLVIAMVGLVGSGKTPVAEMFARELGAVLVSADKIRLALRKKKMGFDNVRGIALAMVKDVLMHGGNVVVDSDFADPNKRNDIKKVVKDRGGVVFFVRTVCDLDVVIGNIMSARYGTKQNDLFVGADSMWRGVKKPAVVKMREMSRRLPHHFTWSRDDRGRWVNKTISQVYTNIDTTNSKGVFKQVRDVARRLKN